MWRRLWRHGYVVARPCAFLLCIFCIFVVISSGFFLCFPTLSWCGDRVDRHFLLVPFGSVSASGVIVAGDSTGAVFILRMVDVLRKAEAVRLEVSPR